MKDLGCISNIEVINRLVSLDGKKVIDAGCGDMTLTRRLAGLGASVLAIDPDPIQAKINRSMEPIDGVKFVDAGANKIPVEPQSVDGVFFSYSLHHIPQELYPQVFSEVKRVLKPGGFLLVIEPTACPLNNVMKLFHNEDKQRAAALQAIDELATAEFDSIDVFTCHSFSEYESFDQFARHFAGRSFNSLYTEDDVRHPDVEAAFDKYGGADRRFKSRRQIICLQGLKNTGND